jgi:hypothetical protein
MNQTGYTVLKIPKNGAAFTYAKEARDFATGATGVGGYLNASATASGWSDVRFVSAIREASDGALPVSIGATASDIYTGATTVIGGTTPIGDLRSENGPYSAVGSSDVYNTKKGEEYRGAFYATYIGGTNSLPTKIGVGTSTASVTANGYFDGSFTTNDIHEFQTSFTADSTDLSKITTGSGVYTEGADVTLQFNILNRNGEQLSSAAQIAADPFVSGQKISILNTDGTIAFSDYRIGGDSTFTFSSSQNIDVFGTFTRNFGIRNQVVNQDGGVHTSEFYLYANTATFDKVFVRSSGQTVLNESYTNNSPPNTGSIPTSSERANALKYFNNQPINDSGVTGFIEFDLGFNESPNFTSLGDLVVFYGTGEDFETNRGSLVGNFPLNSVQEGQRIRLTANDGIPEATGLFFKLAADTEVGFNEELFTVGPFTLEPEVEGPDLNLYNQGDQTLVGDFTIEGGLEGDDADGGNLNVSGNALGTGEAGRLTGPTGIPYLLSGDAAGGGSSDTLQDVVDRDNATTTDINYNGSKIIFNGDADKSIGYSTDSPEGLLLGADVESIKSAHSDQFTLFPNQSVAIGASAEIIGASPATGSAVLGGTGNRISGHFNTLVGGAQNKISGDLLGFNFIGGGSGIDVIDSQYSSSVGGYNNDILDSDYSVIAGGFSNKVTGVNGIFMGGGFSNTAKGASSVIVGGQSNTVHGNSNRSFIGAGASNVISGEGSVIGGGLNNTIEADRSVIIGGLFNEVKGGTGVAAGAYSKVQAGHGGAFVFSDSNSTPTLSTGANAMVLNFAGGVHVPTSGVFGEGLFVSGVPVLTGENNPAEADTLQTVTDRGATSTNAINVSNTVTANLFTVANEGKVFSTSTLGLQLQANSTDKPIIFSTNSGGMTERMRITRTGVGIGVPDPMEMLELGAGGKIGLTDSAGTYDSVIYNDGTTFKVADGSGSYHVDKINLLGLLDLGVGHTIKGIGNSIIANKDILAPKDGSFGFRTYGATNQYDAISSQFIDNNNNALSFNVKAGGTTSEAFRIDKDGNIGVDTTAPLAKFDVRGDISGSGSFLGTGVGNRITNNGTPYLLSGDSPAENDTLQDVTTRGNTTTTSILSTGPYISGVTGLYSDRVGIGTNDPDAPLHVKTSSNINTLRIESAYNESAGGVATIKSTAQGSVLQLESATTSSSRQLLDVKNSDGTVFEIQGDGLVGIGTTDPDEKLEVHSGHVLVQSSPVGGVTPPSLKIGQVNNAYQAGLISSTHVTLKSTNGAGNIYFQPGNTYRGILQSDGKMGVNTITPNSTLHVEGDITGAGDVLGTGAGNRITNQGVPYLLSGDSPAETDTLQTVTARGNTTNTSIFSTGPYISGVTGLFNKELHVGDLGSDSHAFNFEKGDGLYDTNIVLKPFGNPAGFNSAYWMTMSKQAYSGFITNGNSTDFYIGHDLNKTALKLKYDGGGVSTFTTSNTDINFEDGTLFVDESAQRVGIGTTGPQSPLEVTNDTSFDGIILKDAGGGLTTILGADGSNNSRARFYNGSHQLAAEINANAGSPTYFNAGDVGIGTNSPDGIFNTSGGHVLLQGVNKGYVRARTARANVSDYTNVSSSILTLANYYGQNEYGQFVDNAGSFVIQKSGLATHLLKFSTTDMIVSGYGIKFAKNQTVTSLAVDLRNENGDEVGFYSPATNEIGFVTDRTEHMRIDSAGNVGVGTENPNSTFHVEGVVSGSNSFLGTGDGNRITNNGVPYLLSGDSPAETQNLDQVLAQGNTSTRDMSVADISGSGLFLSGAGSAGPEISLQGTYTTWEIENQYAGGANNDMFRIRNTALADDALVINRGNNNLGIGTTNPSSKLHVESTNTSSIRAYNGSRYAAMGANSNAAWITAGGSPAHGLRLSAGANGAMSVYASRGVAIGEYPTTDPGVDNFTVQGNVGLGTTTALAKLDVRGTISGSGDFLGTGVDNRITNNGVPYLLSGDSPAETQTLQDVCDNGNTTTTSIISTGPHISGVTGLYSTVKIGEDGVAGGRLITADSMIFQIDCDNTSSSSSYRFRKDSTVDAGTELMRIQENGNVGIGTDAPSQTLHVKGIGIIEDASSSSFGTLQFGTDASRYVRGNSAEIQFGSTIQQLHFQKTNGAAQIGAGASDGIDAIQLLARNVHTSANIVEVVNGNGASPIFTIDYTGNAEVTGSIYGTGAGNRITKDGIPYLLSGDSPAETQTLQDVCDNGNETTTSILSTGPYISGVTGLFEGSVQVKGAAGWAGVDTQGGAIYMSELGKGLLGNMGSNYARPLISSTTQTINIGSNGTSAIRNIKYNAGNGAGTADSEHNFYTSGNNVRMHIAKDGNVGIGTSSPDAFLNTYNTGTTSSAADVHIVGSGNTYGLLVERLRNDSLIVSKSTTAGSYFKTDSATASYQGYEIGSTWFMGQYGYNDFRITDGTKSGGTAALTIQDSTQNVGIGTTAPVSKLTVESSANALADVDEPENHHLLLRNPANDTTEGVGMGFLVSAATSDVGAAIVCKRIGNNAQSELQFWNKQNTTVDGVITQSMTISEEGNVGIGSNSPAGKLQVYTSANRHTTILGSTADLEVVSDNNTNPVALIKGVGTADLLNVFDNTTEVFTILDGGNVGIGTNNPQELLHIDGSSPRIRLRDSNAAGTPYSHIDASDGALLIEADKGDETASSYIALTVDGSESIRAIAGGNVGIGTTEPADTLQVAGQVRIDGSTTDGLTITSSAGASQGLLLFNNSSTDTASIINYYNGPLLLGQNNAEVITIDNDSVGINVAAPAGDKLMVKAENNYFAARLDGATTAGQSNGLRVRAGYNSTDRPVLIEKADGSDVFIIDGLGNVGIGSSPSYKLDVNGTTRSTYYIGGAYLEENASSSKLKLYPDGTVLVINKDGELEPCKKENDTLVFGVSKIDFDSPVVLGAEPVLVTGPVEVGDYIVTSNKQGHGQAVKDLWKIKLGTVIAQAMESGDGESYNIKAMVRKM